MNLFFFHTSKKWGSTEKKPFQVSLGLGKKNLTLVHPGLSEAENPEDYYYYSYYLHLGFHSIACVWHFVAGWLSLEFGKSQDFEM